MSDNDFSDPPDRRHVTAVSHDSRAFRLAAKLDLLDGAARVQAALPSARNLTDLAKAALEYARVYHEPTCKTREQLQRARVNRRRTGSMG